MRVRLSSTAASAAQVAVLATLSVAVFAALPAGPAFAGPQTPGPQASLPQLEGEVMCPTCGTLLELSHAPAAERERAFIRRLINQGKTEDEIKDALVAEYGPQALALPDEEGINFWAYVLPLIVFAVALAGLIFGVASWRRNRAGSGGTGPGAGDPTGPEGEDAERLDRDMARFDL